MSVTVVLRRVAMGPQGTFGVLTRDNLPLCVTCEDPWMNNARGTSCIPAGTYRCVPHSGPRYKNVWRLEGVKDRTAILIHAGNTIKDTQGCILVGQSFAQLKGLPSITNSRLTLDLLRGALPETFILTVINPAS